MKFSKLNFILITIVVIFFCCYVTDYMNKIYDVVDDIDIYIISMKGEKRMQNIEKQTEKLKKGKFNTDNVHIIDAIVGKTLDLDKLISEGVLDANAYLNEEPDPAERLATHKREVGCYLSHMKAYETVLAKNKDGYSIIFEDDFNLLDNFLPILDETLVKIKKIEFDILFLSLIAIYRGDNVVDNIYHIHDSEAWGAHAYLINNKSVGKIIEKMKYIETVLDKQLFDKGRSKELTVLRLDPLIANTSDTLSSGIRGAVWVDDVV